MSFRLHIAGTFATQITQLIVGLAASILSTRLLGPSGKGEYAIFVASISLSALVFDFGTTPALNFLLAKGEIFLKETREYLVRFGIVTTLLFSLALFGTSLIPELEIFIPAHQNQPDVLVLVLLCFLAGIVTNWFKSILQARLKFGATNLISLSKDFMLLTVFSGIAIYLTLSGLTFSITSVTAYYIFGSVSVVTFLLALFLSIKKLEKENLPVKESRPLEVSKKILSWGGKMYLGNVAQFLNYRLDIWIVNYFLMSSQLGIYSLGVSLSQMIWLLPTAISQVLLPTSAKASQNNQGAFLSKTLFMSRIVFVIGLTIIVIAAVAGRPVINLLYGEEFSDTYQVLMILLLGTVPFAMTKIHAAWLASEGLQTQNIRASLFGLVATVILDLFLIPRYGITGAAVATTISYLVSTTYLIWVIYSRESVPVSAFILPGKSDIQTLSSFRKKRP